MCSGSEEGSHLRLTDLCLSRRRGLSQVLYGQASDVTIEAQEILRQRDTIFRVREREKERAGERGREKERKRERKRERESERHHLPGTFMRRIDSCITQLKAQGPSRTCTESKEEEEEEASSWCMSQPLSSQFRTYKTGTARFWS